MDGAADGGAAGYLVSKVLVDGESMTGQGVLEVLLMIVGSALCLVGAAMVLAGLWLITGVRL